MLVRFGELLIERVHDSYVLNNNDSKTARTECFMPLKLNY